MFSRAGRLLQALEQSAKQFVQHSHRSCSTKTPLGPGHIGKDSGIFAKLESTPFPSNPPPETPPSSSGSLPKAFAILGNTLFLSALGGAAYFGYYTYAYDQNEMKVLIDKRRDAAPPVGEYWAMVMDWYLEKRKYFEGEIDSFAKPRQDRLLPDQYNPLVKTLVLDLDDLLVHSDWTRERGWKVFKRPGLEFFVQELLPYYEIVVYSDQMYTYVEPIMDRVDPQHGIHRLHRPDTLYVDGKHVRDLSRLGRDMGKVLMISAKPDAWALQPQNTLKLHPWKGDLKDTVLLDLIPFLQFLAQRQGLDMRDVVSAYDGKDIAATFKQRMKELENQQQAKAQQQRGLFHAFQKTG